MSHAARPPPDVTNAPPLPPALSNVASFVFPAYESFRAIEKPGAESKLW